MAQQNHDVSNHIPSSDQGGKYMGAQGELAPKMPKRAPKISIEFNAKQIKECYFHASKLEKVAPKFF